MYAWSYSTSRRTSAALDVWTYDLLHIALYAYNTEEHAQTFLPCMRAKGYQPQVIVTDLRQDYGPVVAQIFPQAVHHLCIFHALQDVQKHIKDVYGPAYADTYPEAERLKQQPYAIFNATTLALATERYTCVLALRQDYVPQQPQTAKIFDFLERHWPKLANSIGSSTIPATNNTVELVIHRFDQHYQNFCGFESPTDAQRYLWPSSKRSTASPPSPKTPNPASAASRRCSWLAIMSPACSWSPSARA